MTISQWVNAAADGALAVAAIWVSFSAISGWRDEVASRRPRNAHRKAALEADARAKYVSASLQRPTILILVFGGSLTKLILTVCALWSDLQTQ
jgi:uncharacterized membrane protein YbhN (UPF0104 family)